MRPTKKYLISYDIFILIIYYSTHIAPVQEWAKSLAGGATMGLKMDVNHNASNPRLVLPQSYPTTTTLNQSAPMR